MLKIKREKVESGLEKKICIGLITNTSFLSKVRFIIKPHLFKSKYLQKVSQWCLDYFDKYNSAPNIQIEDIFKEKSLDMEIEERDNIGLFLSCISSDYEKNSNININFLTDETEKFFKKEAYLSFVNNIVSFSNENSVDIIPKVEDAISSLKKESVNVFSFSKPLEEINNYFDSESDLVISKDKCGDFGKFLGDMRKEWVVSFQAPEKGGKSFFLNEMIFLALEQNKKVLFISLEMSQAEIEERFYNRLTGAFKTPNNPVVFPVMDCEFNQTGECFKTCRAGRTNIMYKGEKLKYPLPYKFKDYKPCTFCRGHQTERFDFQPACWFEEITIRDLDNSLKKEKANIFNKLYKRSSLVMKSFPAMTASIQEIRQYIMFLENSQDFFPDVVIIDYLDILDNNVYGMSTRDKIDYNWKKAKQMAQECHFLLISAEQSRKLYGKEVQDVDDVSEDKRKNAHIDAKFSINQTEEEKDFGVRRIGTLLHRHRKVTSQMLYCLGLLEIAYPVLDCELVYYKNKTKKTNNFGVKK